MNQTKKRLSIINLAISITDIETIQLQILKLGLLKTDTKIQEIIAVLQAENYAKAQRLIKVYIDTPIEEILQRASQQKSLDLDLEKLITVNKKETIISEEDQKIIDEFQLFTTNDDNRPTQTKKKEIDINDYLPDMSDTPNIKIDTPSADFDALLNLEATDVMPDNIELDISQDPNESFFNISVKEEKPTSHTENVPRDTFFDMDESEETLVEEPPSKDPFETLLTVKTNKKESLITKRKASLIKDALKTQAATEKDLQGKGLKETALKEIALKETALRKKVSNKTPLAKTPLVKKETAQKPVDIAAHSPLEKELLQEPKVKTVPESYPAISYIRQKFVSMRKQYEPIQKNHDRFPTVETFLTTISQDGYKEKEIEETLVYVEKLIKEQKFAEAGQLQLVCASTESNFAQLMLARELYRGILLRKNVSEAFYILTHMADDNYPEALCDLGQFHENGIGTGRNKKVAEELYKKAMDMGIKRAEKHYARLKKQNKGFFKK
jgi:hypothetical protein